MDCFTSMASPVGTLRLMARGERLIGLEFADRPRGSRLPPDCTRDPGPFREAVRQLEEYFEGCRRNFELALAFERGTPFEREVWGRLLEIPYGETLSYAALAARIGRARAVRAVGAANAHNPIAIVVPCHRVVAADGALRGYGGGLAVKAALLALERAGRENAGR